ncbi:response regulator [Collimonas arenae]|uniref:Chemotaxis protein CheA n=1 Tax=Collimonas arenae TaxID=279058 RepID=A0A127PLN9_9BURK|nr:Hpt domain-containing protein [Collimonas arenae]AMO98677.1 response regulator [Collimonas arenae]AMP08567.1 response regulator [Collimonas arenae]
MTTDFSSTAAHLQDSTRTHLDTGPLSWVMSEIREALSQSGNALSKAADSAAGDDQSTAIRHAKTYLHQAHGALQMVDIDGVTIITETVEDILERAESGQAELTAQHVEIVRNAYQALIEYLDELLAGGAHQPVRLFPYYQSLLEIRGAERIHPADLFFPDLTIRPHFPEAEQVLPVEAAAYLPLRKRFERALLPFLKSADKAVELENAGAMQGVVGEVEQMQRNQQSRSFWWVMHGFSEAVAAAQISNELYVKQLFARINLQLRRLSQGSSSISERLLRDALFFIAGVEQSSKLGAQIRAAYRLNGLVPSDYGTRHYGQISPEALSAAKERLTQAKNMWDRLASGDAGPAAAFEQEMLGLSEAGSSLNAPSLSKLLRELNGIARHAAHSRPGDAICMEIATSLLFIENTLNHISRLPENFSERADAMTARLLSVVSGETLGKPAQWIDDIYREAQQRQTVKMLASEMLSSLRQVEKMLDEFFNDPERRDVLTQIGQVLYQIQGALAIQDQTDALRVVEHTRNTLQRFAAEGSEVVPDQKEFERIAQNIGALSFFIETLQHQSDTQNNHFTFDEEAGVFRVNLLERRTVVAAPQPDPVVQPLDTDVHAATESLPSLPQLATVEDELLQHQNKSAELALSLTAQPHDAALQEQLKESLVQMRVDATLSDNPEANERAQAAIDILDHPDFSASQQSLAEIVTTIVPLHAVEAVTPAAVSVTDEEADAELREIFLSEADEVLTNARQTLPQLRDSAHSQEPLTVLRRAFHTLKGSSRMIGLNAFGEAAWSIEQVLNVWLSESRPVTADLQALLDHAVKLLDGWVKEILEHGQSQQTPQALTEIAERVRHGGAFVEPLTAAPVAHADVDAVADVVADAVLESTETLELTDLPELPAQAEEIQLTDEDLALFGEGHGLPSFAEEEKTPVAAEFEAKPSDVPDVETFVADVPAEEPASAEVIAFPGMQEIRHDDSTKQIGDLMISLPLYNIYLAETDQLVRHLAQDFAEWRHEPERPVMTQSVHAAHSLAGSSATVGFKPLQEVAHALEMALQRMALQPGGLHGHDYDTLQLSVERIKWMLQQFTQGDMPYYEPALVSSLDSLWQRQEPRAPEAVPEPVHVEAAAGSLDAPQAVAEPEPAGENVVEHTNSHVESAHAQPLSIVPTTPAEAPVPDALHLFASGKEDIDPSLVVRDELDADLLPVFLEEGSDMLPQIGSALRTWQQNPADNGASQSILRHLHTIKGSARMAGAMVLGQHMHEMESHIEVVLHSGTPSRHTIDELLAHYDRGVQMFDNLRNPQAVIAVAPSPAVAVATEVAATEPGAEQALVNVPSVMPSLTPGLTPAAAVAATASGLVSQVRVNAEILDRLVNQAGEVSITRSRLESGIGTLQLSLSELTENVDRLRSQLREIEIQAEAQISSRMTQAGEREFDPLEFDRFTRLQELTRMMAESVNDVASLQKNLTNTVEGANADLLTQGRLTRELQQDLMHVRMVQFASIAERLYRLTRQVSKELDKRVNLDIRGSHVEIDRSVLEKMVGPFEHLLRNAIVHGIESREARRAAGKNETGELKIEIRQDGNEILIKMSDDGQGLNLGRIRDKARTIGLLENDQELSDLETTDLIFRPGFSTASDVTELAGRGVGMDVVRSEAASLGGRVEVSSDAGAGTQFTIHLPLTLAVTQVVILTTGGNTYAVPSALVEQVQQLKAVALAAAYNDGMLMWQGHRVPLQYLSALLGDADTIPVAQQYSPVIILRTGNDRVAIHVDEIIGNREVVVKNIGPQLSRMIGIAGATVLGSGDIVLILNPVPLAQRFAHEQRAPRISHLATHDALGAVAEMAAGADVKSPQAAQAVQGLRSQNVVMVVDDSLTVRRVTQRLLSREGYQVVLAKDGVDALEQLQAITPDVMLVDIEMPRMDGFDLTRNIRNDDRTRHIPIIMITSRTASKHRSYAMELGVNEYLGKPYQEDELMSTIKSFIKTEDKTLH